MFCPYCGAEVAEIDTFCGSCGTRLDSFRQALEASKRIEEANAAAAAAGETQVIVASGEADPYVTQMIGNAYDPDRTQVFSDTAAEDEFAAMEAALEKGKMSAFTRDFTGLEVLAGEQTGYIPPLGASATSVMPVIDDEMLASRSSSAEKANVVMSAPDGKKPKGDEGKKKGKGGRIALVVLLLIVVAAAIGGYLWYTNEQDIKAKAHSMHAVPLSIVAEGYDVRATGTPVKVEGTDLDGNAVSGMYYVNSSGEGIELMRGEYTFTIAASPIGSEGELWSVPSESIAVAIPDTIEPYAAFEVVKETPIAFKRIDPIDVTVDTINLAYEYAKYDPTHGTEAAAYRDAAIKARETALAEAEAEAEAARIAAEEEAARIAEEEARAAASKDGYYSFSFAPTYVDTTQDDYGYWHIAIKKSNTIKRAASLDGLSKQSEYVSSLVFYLPSEGVSYETSGGTAGVKKIDGAVGYSTLVGWLKANSAQGLEIIVHVVDGEVVFARFSS